MLEFFVKFLLAASAIIVIILVMLQRGKGGGLAGALGGMGGQSAFGTKAGDLFTKITVGVASFWILISILTAIYAPYLSVTRLLRRRMPMSSRIQPKRLRRRPPASLPIVRRARRRRAASRQRPVPPAREPVRGQGSQGKRACGQAGGKVAERADNRLPTPPTK